MKVIFLDFDGVLNHESFYSKKLRGRDAGIYIPEAYPQSEFCPESISYLNQLCEETGAVVVVTSTWRHGRSVDDLADLLKSVGFTGKVEDKTDSPGDSVSRGIQIRRWLNDHGTKCDTSVILDDSSDMLESQMARFVNTSFQTGLDEECYKRAKEILESPNE